MKRVSNNTKLAISFISKVFVNERIWSMRQDLIRKVVMNIYAKRYAFIISQLVIGNHYPIPADHITPGVANAEGTDKRFN